MGALAELAICLRRRYLFRSCGRAIFAVTSANKRATDV
jgi:hypothetical protein